MKRRAAAILWFFSGWTVGEFLAFVLPAWGLGISPALGPILGTAAAAIVAADPRRLIWARPATPARTESATNLAIHTPA
mgnify:CR=1 FL=1